MGSPATMVAEARKHVGYREKGNNDTIFNRWLGAIPGYPEGGYGYPWCHSFVSYCLWHSDNANTGPRTAGCEVGVAWFKSQGRWHSTPQAGDLVYYGAGGGTHVELVSSVGSGSIRTIGGNTSGTLGGHFFNGDGVYEKSVSRSSRIAGYGRPRYRSSKKPKGAGRSVAGQQRAVNGLGYRPKLEVDGQLGPKTAAGIKWLQKKVGAVADGQWGPETESKYKAYHRSH
jgi:CHAP domain/Putative peptidoglycan binding domain